MLQASTLRLSLSLSLSLYVCVCVCRNSSGGSRQSCWKRRSRLERALIITLIVFASVLAAAVIALIVMLATGTYIYNYYM